MDSGTWLVRRGGAHFLEPQRPVAQQPPQALNDLVNLLRDKSNKNYDEALKDTAEAYKHQEESNKCSDAANEIDAAIAASSALLPPSFYGTPAYALLRRESSENRNKSEKEFQEALNEHQKASFEKGRALTYHEDAQTLEDEIKKKKKGSNYYENSMTIAVLPKGPRSIKHYIFT